MINGIGYLVSALTVYIIVSALKPFFEATIIPAAKNGVPNVLHDPAIRLLAFLVGAASNLTIYFVYTAHHDGPGIFTAALVGIGAALTAIGTYHLETTNYFTLGQSTGDTAPAPVNKWASLQAPKTAADYAAVDKPLVLASVTKAEIVTPAPLPVPPALPDPPAE